jgi:L-alanine-DL-glutamate epimerase-like enolase superfamily enzyme
MLFKPSLDAAHECWPLASTFTIARGSKDAANVVVCTLTQDGICGRGECVPYARYGESVESVISQIKALEAQLPGGITKRSLQTLMPAGAARFAVDAALWDLEAKTLGTSAWAKAGVKTTAPLTTAYTIVYNEAAKMGADAAAQASRPLLKIKLAQRGDLDRLKAVREGAPDSELIVDANEGWSLSDFEGIAPELERLGVTTVEQPLPAGKDSDLKAGSYPFNICADESCHDTAGLEALAPHYDMINIKLDKTGGLTEALKLKKAAQAQGMKIMVGCMVGTSLAMAPAMAAAHDADLVDLDGPLLMKKDRGNGIRFEGSLMHWPDKALWGC